MRSNKCLEIRYDAFINNDSIEDFQDIKFFKKEINKNYNNFVKANFIASLAIRHCLRSCPI